MSTAVLDKNEWILSRMRNIHIGPDNKGDTDFINGGRIFHKLSSCKKPEPSRVRDIIAKSLEMNTLSLTETAYLLNITDKGLWNEAADAARRVKKKVYDNRIVTFAPLYISNYCVNDCAYCGFRSGNRNAKRRKLSPEEVKEEVKVLAGEIGHKRLIVVYGEHPDTDIDYITDTIKAVYSVKVKTKNGTGRIRRVNVNAPPLTVEELRRLKDAGIGTYQVFQETYHHDTYRRMHPAHTIKGNYMWRLYCMHRAMEAGIDDVGLGALFGLYDWRFEVMGLLAHTVELERRFGGVGPHTISVPRLEPASGTAPAVNTGYKVSDSDFKKIIIAIRLSVPYTGLIITARESAEMRMTSLSLGVTQTDASAKIGIGAYSNGLCGQDSLRQQFLLGDTNSLDEVIRRFCGKGYITSFCTAGYRCGRTGRCIMELLKNGKEGMFCKLNAVLTFREWIDDFASGETKADAEKVIEKEIREIKEKMPDVFGHFMRYYGRIKGGERDLYF